LSESEDRILAARVLDGDKDAFAVLAAKHRDAMYSFALRMLGDREEAYDAAQETFIRAYTRLDTFDQSRRFRSWLFAIAANICTDLLRRRGKPSISLDDSPPIGVSAGDEASPADAIDKRELQRTIAAAFQHLDRAERTVIILKHIHGFTYEEIAEMTDIPVGTAKSHTHRARRKLAELLQQLERDDTR